MTINVNKDNFDVLKNSKHPVLLDFYAEWCGPCRAIAPVIEEVGSERSDLIIGRVNVDENPEIASAFKIYSIPTLVVLKDGNVKKQASGARPKAQILELLEA